MCLYTSTFIDIYLFTSVAVIEGRWLKWYSLIELRQILSVNNTKKILSQATGSTQNLYHKSRDNRKNIFFRKGGLKNIIKELY